MTESEETPWEVCVEEIVNRLGLFLLCRGNAEGRQWRLAIEREGSTVEFPIESPSFVLALRNYLVETYGQIHCKIKKDTALGHIPEGVLGFCGGAHSLEYANENGFHFELSKCPEYGDRYFIDLTSGSLQSHSVFIRSDTFDLIAAVRKMSEVIEEKQPAASTSVGN